MGTESIIANVTEGETTVSVAFKQKTLRYLNEFVTLSCAPDMLANKLFPNAKEITESFAAYEAVRKYMWPRIDPGDPNVVVVAVGDGNSPRTGATFAYRTRWKCFSIDPVVKPPRCSPIDRLETFPCKVEEITPDRMGITAETVVVLAAVHSHASLEASVKAVTPCKDLNVVAMPCCFPHNLEYPLTDMYHDWGVHSPHRLVKVWTKLKL